MSAQHTEPNTHPERHFLRFSLDQRWEHTFLFITLSVLLLTGLPQKYRAAAWSQQILSTPERVELIQTIHHIAAIVLVLETVYHLGGAIVLMARRRLPGDLLPTVQDFRDAGQMVAYLLFLRKDKPKFGKFNFEQKVTYWFIFFGVAIMIVSGLILLFPEAVTRILPGGVIPAAKLAHSTEAIVAAIFVALWHIFHVHIERLNLSIFTGQINESDLRTYHALEYERLTGQPSESSEEGGRDV